MRIIPFCLALLASPVAAHELWLEPVDYMIEADGRLQAQIVNGQEFAGSRLSYVPQLFTAFDMALAEQSAPVENRPGSRPALDMPPLGEGLHVVSYVSSVSRVKYEDFAKFLRFAAHKDFPNAEADHLARGLPTEAFYEAYSRFAKTLIAVGEGAGNDSRLGLETEIVALDNPYTSQAENGIRVQVFYGDAPRAGAQYELFDKAPDGAVTITYHRADAQGIATLPVTPGHSYLVDAVVLREPSPELAAEKDAVWETLWAALTFAVPD